MTNKELKRIIKKIKVFIKITTLLLKDYIVLVK